MQVSEAGLTKVKFALGLILAKLGCRSVAHQSLYALAVSLMQIKAKINFLSAEFRLAFCNFWAVVVFHLSLSLSIVSKHQSMRKKALRMIVCRHDGPGMPINTVVSHQSELIVPAPYL